MKLKEFIFPFPVKVLQVYCNLLSFKKEERSFEYRREDVKWHIRSMSGYVANNELFLPERSLTSMNEGYFDLITMEDYNRPGGVTTGNVIYDYNRCLDLREPQLIHQFKLLQQDALELYLSSDGVPVRKKYKLCDLVLRTPVEIQLNFKGSNPLRGTERLLQEHYYVYEYLGEFKKCCLLREPLGCIEKIVPEERKVIDLLKKLWM